MSQLKGNDEFMKIKGAIFDFDGTLFDSMSIWETAGKDYLQTINRQPKENLWQKLRTMSLLQSADFLKTEYGLTQTINEIIDGINQTVEEFYFNQAMPKENVVTFLNFLKSNNIKMCIATATDCYLVEAALKRCHMLNYFEKIYTCSEVGFGKDQPHIFNRAAEFLQTTPDKTAVFEDSYYAAKTAKLAGFKLVGVYDRYEPQQNKLKEISDIYLTDFLSEGESIWI